MPVLLPTLAMEPLQRDPALPLAVLRSSQRGPMTVHTHRFYELVYVLRGRGIHHIRERPYPIIVGDFYILQPGDEHCYEVDRGSLEIINFIFMPALFLDDDWRQLLSLPGLLPFFSRSAKREHKVSLQPPHDHAVHSLLERMRGEIDRHLPGYHLLCRSLALEVLLTVERAAQAGDPQLQTGPVATAVAYLHASPEEPISMADLAKETGLSANYLGERFKAELGVSVGEYVNRLRIDRARELLAGTEHSITNIAFDTGFDGPSYFGKVFLRLTGHTPRAYRRLTRGT